MHDHADRLAGDLVAMAADLEREFEARLLDSSTLAFRVAYAVLRHRQDAEDVAQEAFARAWRRFRQLRDRDRFRAWLVRITWRLALDRRRADRRRLLREQAEAVPAGLPPAADQALAVSERAARVGQAIDALPEKLRVVVVLANIEEHDIAEVARLLGLPPGTVKSRLFVARKRLKETLQCLANDPGG